MPTPKRTKFIVHIKTHSKKETVVFDKSNNCLIVHVKAKPVHGKANRALITILEKTTGKHCILIKGFTSSTKIVEIEGEKSSILRSITSL